MKQRFVQRSRPVDLQNSDLRAGAGQPADYTIVSRPRGTQPT